MSRDVLLLLEDLELSSEKILRFSAGRSRAEVFDDEMRLDAILRNLHVIGEAVKKLPLEWRQAHPELAWRAIAGLRDVVAHAYFALDPEILWTAIRDEVPSLSSKVKAILAEERGDRS